LYAIVFGFIFRARVEPFGNGHPPVYAVWLFLGLIVFNFFSNGLLRSTESLRGLAGVLNRVRLPALAPILAALVSVGLQSLVELGIFFVVLVAFGNIGWSCLLLPLWAVLFVLFTAGIAAAVAVLAVHLQDIQHVLTVILQFVFFATPIMYPLTMIPSELGPDDVNLRALLGLSPMAQFVEMARTLLYDLQPGTTSQWLVLTACSLVAAAMGAFIVKRFGADVAERLQ
jgi:ABC-type polysaccharide/polyol phosphate export permease